MVAQNISREFGLVQSILRKPKPALALVENWHFGGP
jgi:hypothetical protein